MKIAALVIRVLTGALFVFASASYLLNLMEQPELTGNVKLFMEGIMATGYMMTLVKVLELLCGIALLTNCYVALACIVMAPIVVNIFLFHAYLDPSGMAVATFLVFANVFLAYTHWDKYKPLLTAK